MTTMTVIHNLGEVIGRDHAPDDPLLIEVRDSGDRTFTVGAFHAEADALARGLLKRGLKRGDAVGIFAANSAEYFIAFIGIMRAGLVAVPVNVKLPRETVAHIVRDSSLKLVLADGENLAALAAGPVARIDDAASWKSLLDPGPHRSPDMKPEELAYILYTSGSTGRPKGVRVTHGSLANALAGWRAGYGLVPGETHLQMAGAAFDVFTGDWVRALGTGGRLLICPREVLLDPPALLDLLRRSWPSPSSCRR